MAIIGLVIFMLKEWLIAEENFNMFRLFEKAKKISKEREVVFLCVGNSKIWFDSFGPLMGSLLKCFDLNKFIYGNIRANIKPCNLKEYVDLIYKFHASPYIIVFDSALSNTNSGICVREGSIVCASLSSEKVEVGDLSVTYNITREVAASPKNYHDMLHAVKQVARFILFVFGQS